MKNNFYDENGKVGFKVLKVFNINILFVFLIKCLRKEIVIEGIL